MTTPLTVTYTETVKEPFAVTMVPLDTIQEDLREVGINITSEELTDKLVELDETIWSETSDFVRLMVVRKIHEELGGAESADFIPSFDIDMDDD